MKVSLIQMESNENKEENETKAIKMIYEAIKEKPDIICLSELFLYWGKDFKCGIVDIKEIEKYQKIAKENNVNIILGSVALKNDNDKATNSCFVINRNGDIIKRYDKIHMYKVNRQDYKTDEAENYISGTEIGITEVDGIKIGIGICFDLRFPEYFRELIKQGAEIIFLPAFFRKNTGERAWNILVNARAIENQVYFCACNQTGSAPCGKTKIVSYDGEVIKQIDEEEGIITAELDLSKQQQARKEIPALEQIK